MSLTRSLFIDLLEHQGGAYSAHNPEIAGLWCVVFLCRYRYSAHMISFFLFKNMLISKLTNLRRCYIIKINYFFLFKIGQNIYRGLLKTKESKKKFLKEQKRVKLNCQNCSFKTGGDWVLTSIVKLLTRTYEFHLMAQNVKLPCTSTNRLSKLSILSCFYTIMKDNIEPINVVYRHNNSE